MRGSGGRKGWEELEEREGVRDVNTGLEMLKKLKIEIARKRMMPSALQWKEEDLESLSSQSDPKAYAVCTVCGWVLLS